MPRWTEQQLAEYNAKIQPTINDQDKDRADIGKESILASKVANYAKQHGFPCLCLRQSPKAKGFLPKGWPDVTLLLKKGRTVYIELKAEGGRQSEDQKLFQFQANILGHKYYVVRSYKRFLEIVEDNKREDLEDFFDPDMRLNKNKEHGEG